MKIHKLLQFLLLSVMAIMTLAACSSATGSADQRYISVVKDGNFFDYPDQLVGDAFEDFFSNPSWEYFLSEDDEHIVEFNGQAEYMGEEVNVCIQFQINPDTDEFEVVWSDINEYEMSDVEYLDLIDTVFGY